MRLSFCQTPTVTDLAFLPAAPLELLKIGGQAQMQIFLFGEILYESFRFGGGGLDRGGVGVQFSHGRIAIVP